MGNKPSNSSKGKENELYAIGWNESRQFALKLYEDKNEKVLIKIPTKNYTKNNIIDIKCGHRFIIYIDDKQNYWFAGNNKHLQSAFPEKGIAPYFYEEFKPITYFKDNNITIKKICVSISSLSVFWITDKNKVYANGSNERKELGISINHKRRSRTKQCIPLLIEDLSNVIDIVCTQLYSIALCKININLVINYFIRNDYDKSIPMDIINKIELFYGNTTEIYSTLRDHATINDDVF